MRSLKKIFALFLFFSVNLFYGQELKGYFVNNQNDTIKCNFDYIAPFFDSAAAHIKFQQYLSSIERKVSVILENGQKMTFKPTDIKLFRVKKGDFESYKFVSLKEDPKNFYEEVDTGRISIYYYHMPNQLPTKTFYLKDGELESRETNFVNFRNWIGKMIADNPDLYTKWMDSNKYFEKKEVFTVIGLYNSDFEKKIKSDVSK